MFRLHKSVIPFSFLFFVLVSFFTIIILSGCGGGGGASTTDPDMVFSLGEEGSDVIGFKANFKFTGTISQGNTEENISGTLEVRVGDVFLQGVNFDTYSTTTFYEIDGSTGFLNITGVTWSRSSDDTPVYGQSTVSATGQAPTVTTRTPFDISQLPAVAQVGDSGTLTSWSSSDGTVQYSSWSLAPTTAGHALLIIEATIYDGNILLGTDYGEAKIDEFGDIKSLYEEVYVFQDDILLTIIATRTN